LLVALVLVLLAVCGGLAFTTWLVVGAGGGSSARVAAGRSAGPSSVPAPTATAPSARAPRVVPAGSAAVPFGADHVVVWPDKVKAFVSGTRLFELPADHLAAHPADVGLAVTVVVTNDSLDDVLVTLAELPLWYGPDRKPADESHLDIFRTGDGLFGYASVGRSARGDFTFAVPRQYVNQLTVELRPRPGDLPGRFAGSAG
jgi:hypothetical protein